MRPDRRIPSQRLVDDLPDRLLLVQAGDDDGDLGRGGGHRVRRPTVARVPAGPSTSRGTLPPWRPREARSFALGRALTRFAESPVAASAVFAIALVVYAVVSFALPLQAGRDLPRYLLDYAQLFDAHVASRTRCSRGRPGRRLVTGVLLDARPDRQPRSARRPLRALARRLVRRRAAVRPGRRARRRRARSSCTRATCSSSTSSRATRCSPPPSRSSRLLARACRGVADDRSRGVARPRGRVARLRAPGRAGARGRSGSCRCSPRAARRPRLLAAACVRRRRRSCRSSRSPPHNAVRADDFTVVRGGSASLLFRTFVADRIVRARERRGVRGARRAPSRESCSRTSPTGRVGSTSRRSSPRAALACTTTSPCSPTGRGAGTTTTATSAASPREAIRAHPGAYARGVSTGPLAAAPLAPLRARSASAASASGHRPAAGAAPAVASARDRRRADPLVARGAVHLDARTAGSARCGHRRPSTGSSSATRADRVGSDALDRDVTDAPRRAPGPRASVRARRPASTTSRGSTLGRSCGCSSGSSLCSGAAPAASRSRSCSPPRRSSSALDVARGLRGRRVFGAGRPGVRPARDRRPLRPFGTESGRGSEGGLASTTCVAAFEISRSSSVWPGLRAPHLCLRSEMRTHSTSITGRGLSQHGMKDAIRTRRGS